MALQMSGLHFSYGNAPVLAGVDAQIPDGVFRGVIGANGCGKSTLLKCLIGYLRPQTGTVRLSGIDLLSLPPARRAEHLGYVAQSGAMSSVGRGLSVYETIALGVPRSRRRDSDSIVLEQCHSLGLDGLLHRAMRELSGGQAQRAQVARALAQGAHTILLDEPISNLDLRYQVQVMGLLRRLAHVEGRTVIAVLHELDLALNYCDEVMVLDQGTTRMEGSPCDLTGQLLGEVFGLRVGLVEAGGRTHVVPEDDEEGMD